MKARQFPTAVILSISSGRMLCPFSEMRECVEFLVGVPVFTHQFADRAFANELKEAVLKQHPQLADFNANAISTKNWQQIVKTADQKYGASLSLRPMGEPEHYEGAFTRPLKGKKVLVIDRAAGR